MIERLVDGAVRHRFLVFFAVLLVAALGARAARDLPIDAVPDVTNVQVQVLTQAPALGPLEIEQFVTFPIESVMSGLPRLEEVRSVSRFGLSAVTLVFEEGTDLYFARQLVQERLAQARDAIPEAYGSPEMGPISSGLGEIYQFEVRGEPACAGGEDTGECWSLMELREILDWQIAYALRGVDGVVEVSAFGGELKTFEVRPDPALLRGYDLGLADLLDALEANNASAGGGYLARAGEQRLVRAEGLLRDLDDIRRVVVATRDDGTPIRVADVAEVTLAPQLRQGALTRDGRGETVGGIVMMLIGANSREVARAVDARMDEVRETLPEGVTVDTFYDRTALVDRTVETASTNLAEGGFLVVVVLLLLLGSFRGGLLVASVIPLSMLAAFIGMRALGVSGNLMSLGALDFGILVDGAVVIVEQVIRQLAGRAPPHGPRRVAAAARSVARPVLFAVGIIMLVYVPVLTLHGVEGKMFRPMAITVLLALGASVILALTLMPAACALVFRGARVEESETWLMRRLRALYEPLLERALAHRGAVVGAPLVVVAAAALIAPQLGAEFAPRLDEGTIAMHAMRLPSVSLEETVDAVSRVEATLRARFPDEVESVVSRSGRPEVATDPMGIELSDVYIFLTPRDEWTKAEDPAGLVRAIEAALKEEVPGQAYSFSQPIEMRTNELLEGVRSDVGVRVYGDDLEELGRVGDALARTVGEVPGARDVMADQVQGLPFLDVVVDQAALSRYGVSAAAVTDAVAAVAGRPVGQVFEGQRRFLLQVRWPEGAREDVEALRRLPIALPGGGTVPLDELAELDAREGPASIGRRAVQRVRTIQVNVRGRDIAGFVAEARERVREEVDLPPGYRVEWGGQFEQLQEASERLAIAVPAVLLLIFLLLFMTYGAARPALLVYLNVPVAATGGVFALALRGMPFSISAAVGFIALFGIAVLNGVVLVSTARELQAEGAGLFEATRSAARRRLRPILMTALTDALGFAPMALATSAGAEVQRPLATVVIGGLVTCTLLTLFVLPAVYARWGGELSEEDAEADEEADAKEDAQADAQQDAEGEDEPA